MLKRIILIHSSFPVPSFRRQNTRCE